ncbi:MAG: class I SAM-dependent methyltransferase [Candidatus Bathyarchaeota archaeon]|uniref:class I SAM-dependent DNA methyltransferase n=1 Tax=Candidatus Bathycorpusculum sp. TaxID=2994959 RepID=UPI00281702FA|nr:class I SAM-dependent methyltransferase [Candidatus Termiticorpusculum sp.]MCL2257384.1 class I SAM-dependent methyltransferase [Candidatus Termiticorpusculum sp.]MCL2292517.1 class I SAM-dependent methyltransferase [Candidatus Termiticorpusculum sp.]
MKQIQPNVFDDMGKYWQEIANKGPTKQQVQFIKNNLFSNENWILDLGCGTGRHTIPLTKEAYNIIGIDISTTLLKIAKQHHSQSHFIQADFQHLPFKEKTFTTALSIDNSFAYLKNKEADLKSLKELHLTLQKDAILILDVFNYEQLRRKYKKLSIKNLPWLLIHTLIKHPNFITIYLLSLYKWRSYPTFLLLQKRNINPKTRQLIDLWIIKNKNNKTIQQFHHTTHLYTLNQLQETLTKAGFNIKQIYGGYTNQTFTTKSNRLLITAKPVDNNKPT